MNNRIMSKLMFHVLLFLCSLLLLLSVSVAVASPYRNYPLTRSSRCRDKCGNVTIPFPFGIGANNCFLDEWYEIQCNNSIPRLKKLDLQVLNISFPRDEYSYDLTAVTVNYQAVHSSSSCTPIHDATLEPVNFDGSPFYFSAYNNFVAVGCENVATMKGSNHSYVGCSTECTGNKTRQYSSCDGFDCCQSIIPDGLQGFRVDFQGDKILGTSGGDHDCQFAFLVDSSWFEPNSTDLHAIRDGGYVPVLLEWGILNAAFPTTSIGLKPINYTSYYSSRTGLTPINRTYYYSESARCYHGSINVNTTTFINCQCMDGFYGNPYIEDGCKDINECEIPQADGSMPCGGGLRKCRNTRGYYHCSNTTLFIVVGLCVSPAIGSFLFIFLPWCTCRLIKKRREAKIKAMFLRRIFQAWQFSSTDIHNREFHVSWEARLRIATEVAGALSYLHCSASIPIYHRDIKSSNILLDEQYRVKIADFGTSRTIALDQTHLTTLVQGTFGYLDPEYFQSSQFTDKSDVYSFGVVLVELLTRQKPVCSLRANEGRNLATYFIISMEENRLFDILDATVLEQGRAEEITAVANLAKRCLNPKGRERPMMREVVMELEGLRNPALVAASKTEENQEIKSDHIDAEIAREMDAMFASRVFEMEADVISSSDAHPFLPSKTW